MSGGGVHFYRKLLKSFRWSEIGSLLCDSLKAWNRHKAPRLGASLAFYSLLSLAPLLLVMVSIVGLIFGQRAAQSDVVEQVQELAGSQAANSIQSLVKGLRNTGHGMIATVAGALTLLFGASGVLAELRDALNTIWEVPTPELKGWNTIKNFIWRRLFSVGFVLAIGLLLVITLTISVGSAFLGKLAASALPAPEPVLHLMNELISFIAITGVFAAIYKIVPDVRMNGMM
jgi:membrane protein